MKNDKKLVSIVCLSWMLGSCQPASKSEEKASVVAKTESKRQTIGNCWLYAVGSWLESLYKVSTGEVVNVSESYWTYWDFYQKLLDWNNSQSPDKFETGGRWNTAKNIILKYGWVPEDVFLKNDDDSFGRSKAQYCALEHIKKELAPGGKLSAMNKVSTEERKLLIREELKKGFQRINCVEVDNTPVTPLSEGPDIDRSLSVAFQADKVNLTAGRIVSGNFVYETQTLKAWLDAWTDFSYNYKFGRSSPQIPQLASDSEVIRIENRIRNALLAKQPIVLSFSVIFNAINPKTGMFNWQNFVTNTEAWHAGGHMVVLEDFTLKDVEGGGYIGEGELPKELDAKLKTGRLDYLVVKNSWGSNRSDRPFLIDGTSRISWDYLTQSYQDLETKEQSYTLWNLTFPPGF